MKPFQRNQARPSDGTGARPAGPPAAGTPAIGPARWGSFWLMGILLLAFGGRALADDTNSPALSPQDYFEGGPSTYTDWITLTGGGLLTKGNQAQAEESLHWGTGAFGGIEDLHVQGSPFTNTVLTLDGHSIFDDHDYQLKSGVDAS